jgi:hypothetical protein
LVVGVAIFKEPKRKALNYQADLRVTTKIQNTARTIPEKFDTCATGNVPVHHLPTRAHHLIRLFEENGFTVTFCRSCAFAQTRSAFFTGFLVCLPTMS